jgi:putative addiction module component (TIGR02574 family)
MLLARARLIRSLAKRIAGGWVAGNCKRGIFGFMSKPALNIGDLSPEERLRLIEELWDSLSETPGNIPLTNAQREELDRRLDDLERSGPEGIPWDQVLQQIRSRSR